MRILLFIDSNIKTIPYEVPLLEMKRRGHDIIFLSILNYGPIHKEYKEYGIPVFSMGEQKITLKRSLVYINFFIKFCKKQKINIVFAHLAIPSFISVLSQKFINGKVICFRHHFNFLNLSDVHNYKVNKIDTFLDKVISRLTTKYILPSFYLKELINKLEGVSMEKMDVIPYAYDWGSFLKRDRSNFQSNREDGVLQLLVISRLTKLKRPDLALELLGLLINNNIKAKLTFVGTGELETTIKEHANTLELNEHVEFVGFQSDVIPFIKRSNVLIHPSLTEASSSVIKEAGILGVPVIVCNGVGDFNDYIVNGINGWLVDPKSFVQHAAKILLTNTVHEFSVKGVELKKSVLSRFSLSEKVMLKYELLLK